MTRGAMSKKRGNGEGSIYQRASNKRWEGVIFLGYGPDGRPKRKTVSAKTRAEVARKLKELQRAVDEGLPTPDALITVRTLFERWNDDVLAHHVSPSAAKNYMSVARNHIIPTLGRKRLADLT